MENEMENQMEQQEVEVTVGGPSLGVLIALIVALCVGIVGVFTMLGMVIDQEDKSDKVWEYVQNEDGQEVRYCLRMLEEEEQQEEDIDEWMFKLSMPLLIHSDLDVARMVHDGNAYWLYRQDSDEYVLYLPAQDRVTTKKELTVTEETDPDGETALVIRIRTAEEAEEIDPNTQLFVFRTLSENWRGLRVRIILDGREKIVKQMTSRGGEVYTTDEWYIGRF